MNLFVRQTFIKQFLRQRFFSLKSIKNRHQNGKIKVCYAKKKLKSQTLQIQFSLLEIIKSWIFVASLLRF